MGNVGSRFGFAHGDCDSVTAVRCDRPDVHEVFIQRESSDYIKCELPWLEVSSLHCDITNGGVARSATGCRSEQEKLSTLNV